MKHLTLHTLAFALVALPAAALADSNATLSTGQELNFTTGATGSSGGDIQLTSSGISFVGSAKGFDLPGNSGATTYGALTQSIVQTEAVAFSTSPIPLSTLVTGNVFVLQINGGGYAKALVTAASAGSLSLEYSNFGSSSTGPSGPTINKITNNYSYIPAGFTNSGIAPSSIFTIFGSGLATKPTGNVTLSSSAPPGLPTTLAGASISVTVGSTTVTPAMYYAIDTQIAAVLPANTPAGTGTVTVTYNGTKSNAFQIQVVPSALGLDTYYGSGSGLITATDNKTGALISFTNSAQPQEVLVFWGSGSGSDTADSDNVFTSTPHAVNQSNTQVYIGGVQATVLYAGSSGYPGLEQIVVTVPSGLSGCFLSVVVVVNGVPSNFTELPVNTGGGSCTDSFYGITGTQLTSLGQQTTVRSGNVFIGSLSAPAPIGSESIASADFASTTGTSYGGSSGSFVTVGSCIVSEIPGTGGGTSTTTPLDAGAITVQGPVGNYTLQSFTKGSYEVQLPAGAIPSTGGTFTFTGAGGADVGHFTANVTFPNPILNWTNQSAAAAINRSQGFTYTWTGGTPGSLVVMLGSSSDSNGNVSGSYVCYAPQSALSFTVPTYVLGLLPAGKGTSTIENETNLTSFTASGLDQAGAFGFNEVQVNSTYQ